MSSVITTIYKVLTMFPRIPKVPLIVLGTVLKNSQLICGIPRKKTYPIIPIRIRMDMEAQR